MLAQQANFTYESSQRASEAWYHTLVAGQSFAKALLEVRLALALADRPDWAVPTLQGTTASLLPLIDLQAPAGLCDPLLKQQEMLLDLPAPSGVFVGRHQELRALHLMLEQPAGKGAVLALITGPGGIGKSTLVALAVTRFGEKYRAALTLSCQGYQGIELFLQRIGEWLKRLGASDFLEQTLPDLKLSIEAKIEAAIAALNQVGPILLVIDNLESVQTEDHTLRDVSLLTLLRKLLTNLRGGRVLITGRYAVTDLLPAGKFAAHVLRLDLDDLSPYETQQLLLRHPSLARLGETVQRKLISEFGGFPYVYDLLSSLAASQSLDLLLHDVQGRITQERRQRTAQQWQEIRREIVEFVALEEATRRLSASSRKLLAQLSVLRLPFPLTAIEQGLGVDRRVWQPLLDWSLLRYNARTQTYRLHSITSRYAKGLLNESERTQAQIQLASWYEVYATQESRDLIDFLEAHRLWRAAGNTQRAGGLALQLADTLQRFGLYPLLRDLCRTTLTDLQGRNPLLEACALHELGTIAFLEGSYDEAYTLTQQSLEIMERLEEKNGQAGSLLLLLGMIVSSQGEVTQASTFYHHSLDLMIQQGNPLGEANAQHQLGILAHYQGNYKEAQNFYQQSLAITKSRGMRSEQANTLHQLGMMAEEQGKYKEARSFYQECLHLRELLRDKSGRAKTLSHLSNIDYWQGAYEKASACYHHCLETFEQVGNQNERATLLHRLGMIAREQGGYEEALRLSQQSLEIRTRLKDRHGIADSLLLQGMIAQSQGEIEKAHRFYEQCSAMYEQLRDQREQAKIQHQLGNIAYFQGRYEEASQLYHQSLHMNTRLENLDGQATSLHQLGTIAFLQEKYEEASHYYNQCFVIDKQLEHLDRQAKSLYQLGRIACLQETYEKASDLFHQSLEREKQLGNQGEQAACLYQLGRIASLQGHYEEAANLLHQSLEIDERLGNRLSECAATFHELARVAYYQQEYKEALTYAVRAYTLLDSLHMSAPE